MLYMQNTISNRPWEPIFNVRGRSSWVQTTVFNFLKQLKTLRGAGAALPSIDTLNFPTDKQLRVPYGDLDALCDSIDFVLFEYGVLGVAYGGPDERGTLWIKFYKILAGEELSRKSPLQFIIWISSMRYATVTLEEYVQSIYEYMASRARRIENRFTQHLLDPCPRHKPPSQQALGHHSGDKEEEEEEKKRYTSEDEYLKPTVESELPSPWLPADSIGERGRNFLKTVTVIRQ